MIVDVHHHVITVFSDEAALEAHAEYYYRTCRAGARSERVDVPLEEVRRRFQSYAPDPDGEKLLERMSRAGIDVTLMCLTDNVQRTPAGQRSPISEPGVG